MIHDEAKSDPGARVKNFGGNVTVPTHRQREADSGRHSRGLLPAGSQHTSACLVHWLTEAKER